MKITIVYRYFWPDTPPYALLLSELIPRLVAKGHQVRVIAAQPAYSHTEKAPRTSSEFGAHVTRLPLLPEAKIPFAKAFNAVLFSVSAAIVAIFSARSDVYWTGTTPPVVQAFLVAVVAKIRGAKSVYQIQDIHPEIAIASGQMRHGLLSAMLRKADNAVLHMVSLPVTLSNDMASELEKLSGVRPEVINNFAVGAPEAAPSRATTAGRPVRFVFAGNIGRFQNLPSLVSAFLLLQPEEAELHFVGDGKLKPELEKMVLSARATNVHFHSRMRQAEVLHFIAGHDVALVSLHAGLTKLAYPSKTMSYLAVGVPVLALAERDSDLSRMLEGSNIGHVVDPGAGADEIADAFRRCISDVRDNRFADRAHRQFWHADHAAERWDEALTKLAGTR